MSEIVITVSGGCVRSVYSDDPDTRVVLLDWDSVDASDADEHLSVPSGEVQQTIDELLEGDDQRAVVVDWGKDALPGQDMGWSTIRIDRYLYPYEVA